MENQLFVMNMLRVVNVTWATVKLVHIHLLSAGNRICLPLVVLQIQGAMHMQYKSKTLDHKIKWLFILSINAWPFA